MSYERMTQDIARLENEVAQLLAAAEQATRSPDLIAATGAATGASALLC